MPKSTILDTAMLALILNGVNAATSGLSGIADNTATSPLGNLYIALHTAAPAVGSAQNVSEISYTGYARQPVVRSSASPAWTLSGTSPVSASPSAAINFPSSTGGAGGTITYFSIGTLVSGAGVILYSGTVSPNITVSTGVAPQLTTGTAITEA
jgi:hypothetical protein